MNNFSFEAELQKTFLEEAQEMLDNTENVFLQIETNPNDLSKLDKILRLVHTIKGSGLTVGFNALGHFTHKFENLLVCIRDKNFIPSPDIIDILLEGNDTLKQYINLLKQNPTATIDVSKLEAKIVSALEIFNPTSQSSSTISNKTPIPLQPELSATNKSSKGRILVCDDEKSIVEILIDILQNESYDVFSTNSAMGALEILEKQEIDVILSDLKMPKMDGIEFLTQVRKINNFIPVIFISGNPSRENFIKFLELNVHDFVDKPFTEEQILLVAKKALRTKAQWDGLLTITKNCFQSYASIQKITALASDKSLNEAQIKEVAFLEKCMEEMRKATTSLLNSERGIKKL
ncbi:MAG: response regulator [Bdellovibrionota bacterium]